MTPRPLPSPSRPSSGASRRRAAAFAVIAVTYGVIVPLTASLPVQVGLVVVGAVVWAVWVTRPAGIPLHRHLTAQAGQLVLDAVRAVVRTLLTVALAVAVVVTFWPLIVSHLAADLDRLRDQATNGVRDTLTPDLPDLPAVPGADGARRIWDHLTHPTPSANVKETQR